MCFKSVITIALVACAPALLVVGYYFWRKPPFRGSDEPLAKIGVPETQAEEARKKFAFQSLETRIPVGKGIPFSKPMSPATAQRWEEMESGITSLSFNRANLLKQLHEQTREWFVKSPGFGKNRDLRIPYEQFLLNDYEPQPKTTPQPGFPASFPISSGDIMVREGADRRPLWHSCLSRVGFPASQRFWVLQRSPTRRRISVSWF